MSHLGIKKPSPSGDLFQYVGHSLSPGWDRDVMAGGDALDLWERGPSLVTTCDSKPSATLARMPRYFAHISQKCKIRYGDEPGSIGILESLDKFMPIGEASCRAHDENGLAVWTLRIGKQEIPGQWIIVDRAFTPAEWVVRRSERVRGYGQGCFDFNAFIRSLAARPRGCRGSP